MRWRRAAAAMRCDPRAVERLRLGHGLALASAGRRSSPAAPTSAAPRAAASRDQRAPRWRGCARRPRWTSSAAAATTSRAAHRVARRARAGGRGPRARRGFAAPAAARPSRTPGAAASGRARTPGTGRTAGRRAMQILRPWKISRSVVRVQRSRGMMAMSCRSTSSGSSPCAMPSRLVDAQDVGVDGDALRDVVGVAEHDAGRLAAHARQLHHLVHRPRHLAAVVARRAPRAQPSRLFVFARKKPVERMISSTSSGFAARQRPRRRGSARRAGASPGSRARRCTARRGWWRPPARRGCGSGARTSPRGGSPRGCRGSAPRARLRAPGATPASAACAARER